MKDKNNPTPAKAGAQCAASAAHMSHQTRGRAFWIPACAGMTILLMSLFLSTPAFAADTPKETVFERVMRTNTIRCGYVVYPPTTIKDLNTGKLSGISTDIMEEIGKGLGLKIEWVEELGPATAIEGLKTDRYDMVCTTAWISLPRIRQAGVSRPVYYISVDAVARVDDKRFDAGLTETANTPDVRVSTLDGSTYTVLAQKLLPRAKVISAPELTDFYQPMSDVAYGKADIAFAETFALNDFMAKNPGKIRKIPAARPVQLFHTAFLFKGDEYRFSKMIDEALMHLSDNGDIDRIISRYETYPGSFLRVAKPYEDPK